MPRSLRLALMAILLWGWVPSAVRAGESYYLLLFGSEDQPKHLRNSHTWATFVRAVGEESDPAGYQLFSHTISWYPESLRVRVWAARPEPGINLTLEQTMSIVLANHEHIRMWGPFRITPRLYNRSVAIYNELSAGGAQYRAISALMDVYVADCIHAVAAVDPDFGRRHYPLIRIGQPATRYMARQVMMRSEERGFDQRALDNSWLIPALGLDRYPICVVPPGAIEPAGCGLCRHSE